MSKKIIDLRSDTVTKPSKEMLEMMMHAQVGDDVFNEDPTINQLEAMAADMFNKEAALFCTSGTMSNQIALKLHTQPGDEVICDIHSHIYHYETGGMAVHSGIQPKLINTPNGILTPNLLKDTINPYADWLTQTSLISIENTVNRAGGTYYTLQQLQNIYSFAQNNNLKTHIDGARIFNAITETNYTPKEIGKCCNTISVCLSKGLGAPVGSLLIGSKEEIKKARRIRKQMGGGMRQAGILAAAGIFALKYNIKKLKEDHQKAKMLFDTIKSLPYVKECKPVYTNIIIFTLNDNINPHDFEAALLEQNIRISAFGKRTLRMVTHLDISHDDIIYTTDILKNINP